MYLLQSDEQVRELVEPANASSVCKHAVESGNATCLDADCRASTYAPPWPPASIPPGREGKGALFTKFGDIDGSGIELRANDVDTFCNAVKALEPTFGGVHLEDIKAPGCFLIEERLKNEMQIPVFHDDQHGTAIISGAALLNALEIAGKKIDRIRVVVSGAGPSAIR